MAGEGEQRQERIKWDAPCCCFVLQLSPLERGKGKGRDVASPPCIVTAAVWRWGDHGPHLLWLFSPWLIFSQLSLVWIRAAPNSAGAGGSQRCPAVGGVALCLLLSVAVSFRR